MSRKRHNETSKGLMLSFGLNVRVGRKQCGLSQEYLAKQVGLTRTSLVNMEQGRQWVNIKTLVDISEALGLSVSDLVPVNMSLSKVRANKKKSKKLKIEKKKLISDAKSLERKASLLRDRARLKSL